MKLKNTLILLLFLVPVFSFGAVIDTAIHTKPIDTAKFNMVILNLDKKETVEYNNNISRIVRLNNRADVQKDFTDFIVVQVQNNKQLNSIADDVNPSSTTLFHKSYTDYIKDKATLAFITNNAKASDDDKIFLKNILNNLTASQNQNTNTLGSIFHSTMGITPVSSFVDKVIGSVSSWVAINKVAVIGSIKSITAAVNQDQIMAFQNDIKNYVDFYDLSLSASKEFDLRLNADIDKAASLQRMLNADYVIINKIFLKYSITPAGNEASIKKAFAYKKTYLGEEYNEDFTTLMKYCADVDDLSNRINELKSEIVSSGVNYIATIDAIEKKYKALVDPDTNNIALSQLKIQTYATSKGAELINADYDVFEGKKNDIIKTSIQEIKSKTNKTVIDFSRMNSL
jgi:hypothetical protein